MRVDGRDGLKAGKKNLGRKCRKCSELLPVTRYLECEKCKPTLGDDYGLELYIC